MNKKNSREVTEEGGIMSEDTSGLLRTSYDEVSYEIFCRQGYAFADKSGFIESLEDK